MEISNILWGGGGLTNFHAFWKVFYIFGFLFIQKKMLLPDFYELLISILS